ncbi:MAG: DUF2007 domain-containing protein [Firmicutes bacterium]|nr:DUF2007 domain-containing protein [Bacillota bacterium]
MNNKKNETDYVFLLQAYNEVEANIIEGLLGQYNINIIKRYKGNKGYLKIIMGTVFGVDIFVMSKDYKEAMEIIESIDLNESYSDFPDKK